MLKRLTAVFFLLFALPALAGRLATLSDPPPIQVPDGFTLEQVTKSIIAGMEKRHWTVESTKPGEIVAVQSPRDLVVKVRIAYDTKTITITYLDSTNFLYQENGGVREIHEKYNAWVANLARDIQGALQVVVLLNHH